MWLALLFASDAACQEGEKLINPVSMGIRGHYGFIIPHSQAIAGIANANPWSLEADLAWHLMRERIWKHCYCYPRTGISLNYINFGFPEVLGHSLAVYPYIEPYIRPQKSFSISFRFGMGPALLSKVYDSESNPDNFFFSNPLSFIVVVNAALNYRLNSRLTTRAAFNYNHISNGGLSQPNVGMNFPTANLGFDYSFTDVCIPRRDKDTARVLYPDKFWWDAYLLGAMKEVDKEEEKSYPVFGAGIVYHILVGRVLAINGGTEWISDYTVKEQIRREYTHDPASAPDHNRAAALLGFNLLFGRFSFMHQWGMYYYAPYPARHQVYQRYGLNLRFTQKLYIGINVKAHGHVADLMEGRLGVRF